MLSAVRNEEVSLGLIYCKIFVGVYIVWAARSPRKPAPQNNRVKDSYETIAKHIC